MIELSLDAYTIDGIVAGAPDFLRLHLETTGDLAREWAIFAGLPDPDVTMLARAALAHDVGKLPIPREVLLKTSSLTPGEMKLVRRHVDVGAHILRTMLDFDTRTITIVYQYHEKADGTGYPLGLAGGCDRSVSATAVDCGCLFSDDGMPAISEKAERERCY